MALIPQDLRRYVELCYFDRFSQLPIIGRVQDLAYESAVFRKLPKQILSNLDWMKSAVFAGITHCCVDMNWIVTNQCSVSVTGQRQV